MTDFLKNWRSPAAAPPGRPIRTKHVVIGVMIILSVLAVLSFSLYGRGLGDPDCHCTTQGQASWNMGSVLMVLLTVAGLLVLLWRPEMLVSAS